MAKERTCFIIMPISDVDGYEPGHFKRVYEYLLKPACEKAGFKPIRADDVKRTNYIVIDILKSIIDSEMVLCDLSAKNPNVLYELGIRQAFNKPITLVKDNSTDRIFDIQGLRQLDYDQNLRIDNVEKEILEIANTLDETHKAHGTEVNSLIQLLGVSAATVPNTTDLSNDTKLILSALADLSHRVVSIEENSAFNAMGGGLIFGTGGKSNPNVGSIALANSINKSRAGIAFASETVKSDPSMHTFSPVKMKDIL